MTYVPQYPTEVLDPAALVPGTWYCCGLMDEDKTINWNGAPLYLYEGDGCWSDDYGNPVDGLWDETMQFYVSMSAADSYLPQN